MDKALNSKLNLGKLNADQLKHEVERSKADPVKSAILQSALNQINLHKGDASFSFDLSFDLSWGKNIARHE